MATSSVPTAKANLTSQLQARANLAGVQVTNGPPLPSPQREFIWIGTAEGTQEFATFGGQRHESYGLHVVISVLRQGEDVVAADTRCFALSAELEAQLRADPTLSGAVTLAQFGEFRLAEYVGPDGSSRVSELTVTVNCEHWLT